MGPTTAAGAATGGATGAATAAALNKHETTPGDQTQQQQQPSSGITDDAQKKDTFKPQPSDRASKPTFGDNAVDTDKPAYSLPGGYPQDQQQQQQQHNKDLPRLDDKDFATQSKENQAVSSGPASHDAQPGQTTKGDTDASMPSSLKQQQQQQQQPGQQQQQPGQQQQAAQGAEMGGKNDVTSQQAATERDTARTKQTNDHGHPAQKPMGAGALGALGGAAVGALGGSALKSDPTSRVQKGGLAERLSRGGPGGAQSNSAPVQSQQRNSYPAGTGDSQQQGQQQQQQGQQQSQDAQRQNSNRSSAASSTRRRSLQEYLSGKFEVRKGSLKESFGKMLHKDAMTNEGQQLKSMGQQKVDDYLTSRRASKSAAI